MMTLIGTPPNLVIQNTLTGAGFEPLSFFSFCRWAFVRDSGNFGFNASDQMVSLQERQKE